MTALSEHFDSKEFACHCCGKQVTHPKLVNLLEQIRSEIGGKSIKILSGYRCFEHNQKVEGKPRSQHLLGNAADIQVDGMTPKEVQTFLNTHFDTRIGGMGQYATFTHVDVRDGYARWKG